MTCNMPNIQFFLAEQYCQMPITIKEYTKKTFPCKTETSLFYFIVLMSLNWKETHKVIFSWRALLPLFMHHIVVNRMLRLKFRSKFKNVELAGSSGAKTITCGTSSSSRSIIALSPELNKLLYITLDTGVIIRLHVLIIWNLV